MTNRRINVILQSVILLGGLLAAASSTWASSSNPCALGGTGMGGTGIIARGTGMGGTGIQLAGRVMFSSGHVEARSGGKSRLLAKGDPVCVGDTIMSARTASAQIKMVDAELIAVRPATRMRIDRYAFHRKSDDHIMLSLLEGACRIVSGEIGKRVPKNDLVKTPIAIIGIRGTDHEVALIPPGMGAAYPAGVYDKVNTGVTYIQTDKGSVDIHPNQVGFVASQQEMPSLLVTMPAFYNNPSVPLSSSGGEHGGTEQGESGMQTGGEGTLERPGAGSDAGSQIESDAVPGTSGPTVETDSQMGGGSQSLPLPEPQSLPDPSPSPTEISAPEIMTSPVAAPSPTDQ